MQLTFTKLHGLGNDFVVIADPNSAIELSAHQIMHICDRRFGVGADGIILVRPSTRPECAAYMHYINADGSLAQMCGNGVRCFAKFLVDSNMVSSNAGHLVADTLAGPKPISFKQDTDGLLTMATVDMGKPILDPKLIPTTLMPNAISPDGEAYVAAAPIDSPWGSFYFTCVSMGNPHAVCFIDDWTALPENAFRGTNEKSLETFDVDTVGEFFEACNAFPEKTNVEFAEVHNDSIVMRVFERGCRETLACGTGACATSVAATLTGRSQRANDIMLSGGTLHISWENEGNVLMTGPATKSFEGTITL